MTKLRYRTVALAALIALPLGLAMPALAQSGVAATPVSATTVAEPSQDMTDGEVRKVSKDTGKLTIKHGEIKNLDMPPMTMVFVAKDPAMLDRVAAGDKVRFKVADEGGQMVVTEIQTVE